ncbi:MAG TPA: hypothetical protein VHZ03_14230 [Trebonia sp.]|nr:hypothetical protein [Trebonia sp.]
MTTYCRYCLNEIRNDGGEWRLAWTDTDVDLFECDDHAEGHAPKVERDEVLMAEVRDQYRDLGMDEDQIAGAVGVARDAGVFDVPDWA